MTTNPTLIRIADILTDKLGRHLASATSAELEAAARAVVEDIGSISPTLLAIYMNAMNGDRNADWQSRIDFASEALRAIKAIFNPPQPDEAGG